MHDAWIITALEGEHSNALGVYGLRIGVPSIAFASGLKLTSAFASACPNFAKEAGP